MSPTGSNPRPSQRTHIDIHDSADRARWAGRFGVTDERLRKAVRLVGTRATSVGAYLAK